MRLAGAIFDLDGTLADTLPACYGVGAQRDRGRAGAAFEAWLVAAVGGTMRA
jgi:phosphoglycolate phosphatase-like HAD superfamily hydrolase